MKPETYHMVAARQAFYWFSRARRTMAGLLLRRAALSPGFRLLDLGCGPGGNLRMLDALRPGLVVGVDLSPLALSLARKAASSANLVCADLSKPLPFADESFDVVTIMNVLCCDWVTSEANALRETRRVLRYGGFGLITEPAFKILAREMDIASMASRRYRSKEIENLCRSAGLEPLVVSYFAWFGFPILLALKSIKLAKGVLMPRKHEEAHVAAADMKPLSPIVNSVMYAVAVVEARAIAGGLKMPFGTTIVCLVRKMA